MLEKIFRFLKFLFYSILTLRRDVTGLYKLAKVKKRITAMDRYPVSVSHVFKDWVKKQPKKQCIIYEEQIWTFQDMENYGNKRARLFSEKFNLKRGDCIALMMENRPEYVGIWYGMSKIGVITALINTNLRSKVLLHSIEIAQPKLLIYDEELEEGSIFLKWFMKLKLCNLLF